MRALSLLQLPNIVVFPANFSSKLEGVLALYPSSIVFPYDASQGLVFTVIGIPISPIAVTEAYNDGQPVTPKGLGSPNSLG